MIENPFDINLLDNIFRIQKGTTRKPVSRESKNLEFKENFHNQRDEYARIMAGFANTEGGYIIFGVSEKPRALKGMTNDKFENFKQEQFTETLNTKFSPEIHWETYTHNIGSRKFGIIYIYQSYHKPVIANTNGEGFKEGDIFYRYNSRTQRIKYTELRTIIDAIKSKEKQMWLSHIKRLDTIGVENAGIMNLADGSIRGKSGALLLDRDLLKEIRFIKEGEFKEVIGAPTYKIVGEVKPISSSKVSVAKSVSVPTLITSGDLITAFLHNIQPQNPEVYIQSACREQSGYMPIYYYAKLAGLGKDALVNLIKNNNSTAHGKRFLLTRLEENDKNLFYKIPDNETEATIRRKKIRSKIVRTAYKRETLDNQEISDICYVIMSLNKSEIDKEYLYNYVYKIYDKYANPGDKYRGAIFKSISYLDYIDNIAVEN